MKTDHDDIEERTFNRIRSLGPDEPSADFTQKVMQAILSQNRPSFLLRQRNYLWAIIPVPVIILITWGFITVFNGKDYLGRLWVEVQDSLQPFLDMCMSVITQVKDIRLQSTILISFAAILSLLFLEEFFSRIKHLTTAR